MERKPHPLSKKNGYFKLCAPMVRYSKLPFRQLVQEYGCDLTFSPMILADTFRNSDIARKIEFNTHKQENVIIQFASSDPIHAGDASALAAPYCNGVDINCGCPQRWAIEEGIGAYLMEHPDTVMDIIAQIKQRTAPVKMQDGSAFPCSVKIRVHSDLKNTVEMAKRAEKMGADWITVHGRTKSQKSSEPVNWEAIKMVKESVQIPVFYNGDIFTLQDADLAVERTGADGVMAARGLLANPALFAGYDLTPMDCVQRYMKYGVDYGATAFIYHHHLMYMLEQSMTGTEKRSFNSLYTIPSILDYMEDHYGLTP
ncbi:hypothetical protein EDD86DRAFT_127039 [Gorgonomyces haynaldii]|nr:hypothetical protein EDD86DRAFT_127039 [Gorgonomyces haynaldii]